MAYGIEVQNADGRVIISNDYANFYVANALEEPIAAAAGAAWPPSGYTTGSLVMARAPLNTDGFVSRSPNLYAAPYTSEKFAYACDYIIVNPFQEATQATSGYGFETYNAVGDVMFSGTSNNKVFEIVAYGEIPSADTTTTTLFYPSSTGTLSNLSDYFVVLNSTMSWSYFGISTHVDYYYDWTASNTGRIQINRYRKAGFNSPTTVGLTLSYMIMRLKG